MLFNSLDFVIFLPVVFTIYWFVSKSNLKLQNTLLLVSSYIFYGGNYREYFRCKDRKINHALSFADRVRFLWINQTVLIILFKHFVVSYTGKYSVNNFISYSIDHAHFVFPFLNFSKVIFSEFSCHFYCRQSRHM